MSVRYRYGTVSILYRILRVGIGIIPIPYRTDTENAKKWIPIGIGIGMGSVFGGICSSLGKTTLCSLSYVYCESK
ncbi:hypothetical protein Hanom_Chr11g01006961 [Helianthus anomalus]